MSSKTFHLEIEPAFFALIDLVEALSAVREEMKHQGASHDEASLQVLTAIAGMIVPERATTREERVQALSLALRDILREMTLGQRDVVRSRPQLSLIRDVTERGAVDGPGRTHQSAV